MCGCGTILAAEKPISCYSFFKVRVCVKLVAINYGLFFNAQVRNSIICRE
jgi:hypothetical protein